MRNKILYILVFFVLFLYSISYASIVDIEMAMMDKNYIRVEKLALEMLGSSIDKASENKINNYLGLSYLSLGRYLDARKTFQALIKNNPDAKARDKAFIGLFDSYYMDEQYDAARKTIRKILKVSPRSQYLSLIYLKAARINLRLSNWDDAYDYLQKIITKFPKSLEFHSAKQLLEEKRYFAVQVGAFIDRKRAEELANELQRRKEYAYIVETVDRVGRKFYRVRVGQLSLLNDAKILKTKLSKEGYPAQIYP